MIDHKSRYGASFEALRVFCFNEWPSIETVGDIPPREEKSAIHCFIRDHEFKSVDLTNGELVIPVPKNYYE